MELMSATTAHSTDELASLPVWHSWASCELSAAWPDDSPPNPPTPEPPVPVPVPLPPPSTWKSTKMTTPTSPSPPPPKATPRPPRPPKPPPPPPRMSSTLDVSRPAPSSYLIGGGFPLRERGNPAGDLQGGALDSGHAVGRGGRAQFAAGGPRPGRAVREEPGTRGEHAARHRPADRDLLDARSEEREGPQEPADARRPRRPVRHGRLAGRRAHGPCLGGQPAGVPRGDGAGRARPLGRRRPRGHRRREGRMVGAVRDGLPVLRRLPEEDRPGDPRLRRRAEAGLSTAPPRASARGGARVRPLAAWRVRRRRPPRWRAASA